MSNPFFFFLLKLACKYVWKVECFCVVCNQSKKGQTCYIKHDAVTAAIDAKGKSRQTDPEKDSIFLSINIVNSDTHL